VGDVQAEADRAYAVVRGRGHASWRRVLDLTPFGAAGLRFADVAASLSTAPIPFCGSMTRGWTAANITQRLPSNPIILKLGRALGGSRGLDLEAVRPACDLRGCNRETARAAWSLNPALREATAYLRRKVKRPVMCAHIRTGRGETSTYRSFLDHAVAALVRHLRTRNDAPAVYLASDMSLVEIKKLRPQSKAVDKLFRLCDGGESCAFVGSHDDDRFGADVVEWRRRARFARRADRASERVILIGHVPLIERLVEGGCTLKHSSHIINIGHIPIVERLVERSCFIKHMPHTSRLIITVSEPGLRP
jgi:hypothetical protein